jgi:hypothetical protein
MSAIVGKVEGSAKATRGTRERFQTKQATSFRQREADLVPCWDSMRPTFVRYQRLISGR